MITPEYCLTMAQYNRWMNRTLYAAAARLTDEERKRDLGAFFKSIEGTLNHLLWGDAVWFGRFVGEQLASGKTDSTLETDFSALRRRREALDERIVQWAQTVTPEWLATTLHWTSGIDGKVRELPFAVCVMQMFNHETHHRGQVTTLLKQLGIDPGETDLPWLPELNAVKE
jgi:uncharacterized damage-inducible protein DinB